ncbi:MAG: ABC transporter permease [bacterium]|nr:ABC transporter permease [bacterium]
MTSAAFVGYGTIVRKETVRIVRIWTQTILPSVISQTLYFAIFGGIVGARIGHMGGSSYTAFLVPGLVMMSAITNAFSNVASSFFGAKFQRSIEEILVSPMKPWAVLAGYVSGGLVRGVAVAAAVFLVSVAFVRPHVTHMGALIFFIFVTCLIFSLLGFLNGLLARKFDDVGLIPTFVLTPLTYLGGVFYDLNVLPPFWRAVSHANPIVYMIDGFRFGFTGTAVTSVLGSAGILVVVAGVLIVLTLALLRRGFGLKQ